MTPRRLFLCTDLDRTVIPNGPQQESPKAQQYFNTLVSRPEVTLAYVTGRHLALVEQAIGEYELPYPDFAITDVGTRIYTRVQDRWRVWLQWEDEIGVDWSGHDNISISDLLKDIPELKLQEPFKQSTHKLSYYLPVETDQKVFENEIQRRVGASGVQANLVWSIDSLKGVGLLDILPTSANKLHAIEFLRMQLGIGLEETLFAGDSGNDLEVMVSGVPSILVNNAEDHVRQSALKSVAAAGHLEAFYAAQGGYLGMNGNYRGGILEGVVHFRPEVSPWIEGQ